MMILFFVVLLAETATSWHENKAMLTCSFDAWDLCQVFLPSAESETLDEAQVAIGSFDATCSFDAWALCQVFLPSASFSSSFLHAATSFLNHDLYKAKTS